MPHGRWTTDGCATDQRRRAGLAQLEKRMALELVVMRTSSMVGKVMNAQVQVPLTQDVDPD